MVRDSPPRLVVLRALGLGDLLTAVPALRALARAFPDHRRVLAAPPALDVVARLSGAIHEIAPARPLGPLPAVAAGANVAVNLHGRGPQSHRVLAATRPGAVIWFRNEAVPESAGSPRWCAGEHEVRRWCRLLEESGIPADPQDLRLPRPPGKLPDGWRGATVIHAGAGHPERVWPPTRWARIATAELGAGRRVLLTGDRREVGLARAIASAARLEPSSVLAGRTDLAELAKLVAWAGRVVSSDTGVAHLATAMGTPSVTLFGPASPAEWGPLVDRSLHRVLRAGNGDGRPSVADVPTAAVLQALDELPA
jgi:ADP-heptose:LPS heptosyltransferase